MAAKSNNKKNDNKSGQDSFLITGIGASAGGVEALTTFFENVPHDSGIAYVVILHLSPDHDSQLTEVLKTTASIPVQQVTERVEVRPDTVYVIPPNQHLEMQDNHITVSPNLTTQDRRAPVDIFFRTLAESHTSRAVGVILSGTGANGSMGIKRIKERGGAAFVQNPREATYNDMPRNAIATGLIDDIVSVSKLPACIIAYKNSLGTIDIPEETAEKPDDSQESLRIIFMQLRLQTGHDFSNYKRPTLLRRIERRINIRQLPGLVEYAAYLTQHPEEAHSLLKDLLISVTNFFRDKKPFETMEQDILPRIFLEKKEPYQIRIWVAGCATGEEAYSLAMLCSERMTNMIDPPKVQIFATDIDENAINFARAGLYTINDAADVSPERLQRFFTMEGEQYLVKREIREMIIFATHNVLKDPPFSHLDLASCRNMLIYLNGTAQERVMETLHFALNPGGFLMLGTSESVDATSDLYAIVNREDHIYQSKSVGRRHIPVSDPFPPDTPKAAKGIPMRHGNIHQPSERITYGELHQSLLEEYAPPSVVVNTEYDILHLSERAGRYLQVGGGELSRNLLKLIRPELRLELRTALYRAIQRNIPSEARNLKVTIDERTETINIQIRPVLQDKNDSGGFLLVLFEQSNDDVADLHITTTDEPLARQLEDELIRVKSQLRASSDQYEVQTEELKATNEELQAMNEELRSSTEELETSKEELQSINEELRTVNQELKVKVEEATLFSNNLQNLMNSANIGTIFLDRSFRVILYTPAALQIFNLIPSDHSRALSDITNRLQDDNLMENAQLVLDKLSVVEQEMLLNDGRVFFTRFSPYRTDEDRIQGVVITFLDISGRRQAEKSLLKAHHRLQQAMETAKIFAWEMDPGNRNWEWSENLEEVVGFSLPSDIGNIIQLIHPDDMQSAMKAINHTVETGAPYASEYRIVNPANGAETWFYSKGALMKNGIPGEARLLGISQNITERKQSQQALEESESRFRTLTDVVPQIIWTNLADGTANYFNERWYDYSGLTYKESVGLGWEAIVHPEDARASSQQWQQALEAGRIFDIEYRLRDKDGNYNWFIARNVPLRNAAGEITGWFGSATDIENLKQAEHALHESRERLRVTVESATDFAIITFNTQELIEGWNTGASRIFGYTESEMLGKASDIIFTPKDRENGVPQYEFKSAREKGRAEDERWHIRKSNERLYASGVMTPIYDNGVLSGYVKVARDITQQKRSEDALAISEERYRVALQSAEMGAWDWNVSDDTIQWNDQHYSLLGLEPDNIPRKSEFFLRFIHPEDVESVKEALKKALQTGLFQMDAFRVVHPSEMIRWMSGYGRVIEHEDDEQPKRMVGVMYDISDRVATETGFRDKHLQLEIAQRAARVGIWGFDLIDMKGIATPELLELTGYPDTTDTWELDVFLEMVNIDDRPEVRKALRKAASEQSGIELEFRMDHPERGTQWMLMRGQYIAPYDKMKASLMGSLIDITERRLFEEQKDAFIGIASHELRTPVTSIKAYAEVLEEIFEEAGDKGSSDLMRKLDGQVDRLTELIHALLDTTSIVNGRMLLQLTEFDIDELVSEVADSMATTTQTHKIQLEVMASSTISADRERIRQVLNNLMGNAIKYSPNANKIKVTAKSDESQVIICVQDFGIGIDKDIQDKIFERFYRSLDAQVSTFSGLGLGLFISAGIIQNHKGTIYVNSKKGKGSTFCFTLPRIT